MEDKVAEVILNKDEKPKMPKDKPTMYLGAGIKAELFNDFDRYSNGHMILSVTSGEVTSDDGKKLGRICGSIAAPTIAVTIYKNGDDNHSRMWHIDAEQIFAAVLAADEAREKKLAEEKGAV